MDKEAKSALRRKIHIERMAWLRSFMWSCRTDSASRLVSEVAMLHFGGPTSLPLREGIDTFGDSEADIYWETWTRAHRRMIDRAIVRILKDAKKWTAVRKMLIANRDGDGDQIWADEWHPSALAAMRLHDPRPVRRKK